MNVGTRVKLTKKLTRFSVDFNKAVIEEILLHILDSGLLAQDHSLSKPVTHYDKQRLQSIQKAVMQAWARDSDAFKKNIDAYVQKNLARWVSNANRSASKIALWVARTIAADATTSQRRAYIQAGLPIELIRDRWTVPIVRQHMSRQAAKALPDLVKWSTELITRMTAQEVQRLQKQIIRGFEEGQSVAKIRQTLGGMQGFNPDRARNVAIDQTNKITQGILRANDDALGITEGVWVHVAGQYTSRETHKAMNGKKFRLDQGLFDSEVGHYVLPAQEPFCRCTYRVVLPFTQLGVNEK